MWYIFYTFMQNTFLFDMVVLFVKYFSLSLYLHKKQLIPEAGVVFGWVFFLHQRHTQDFVYT